MESLLRGLSGGFLGGSGVKNLPAEAGGTRDTGSIPGLGRPQYSCLENFKDRGARQAIVHGLTKRQTRMSD